jgi:DNA-binding response OmpR family regulator
VEGIQEVSMERGRILIVGNTKESTYEIRNLLDNRRFELEIALSPEVGRSILSERWMNLLIIHTELLDEKSLKLFEFLADREIDIPIMIVGEEAAKYREVVRCRNEVECFEKPYHVDELLSFIREI